MAKKKSSTARTSKRPTKKASAAAKPARRLSASARPAPKASVSRPHVSNGKGHAEPRPLRIGKSPLSAKELRQYKALLLQKRAEILGDMTSMSRDALNSDSANLSHMPIHMADVGSDNYEQELTLGLVESERRLLTEIDYALERIAAGTYGVCEATGKPIGKARLNAKPWAKFCIEAAREYERNGGR